MAGQTWHKGIKVVVPADESKPCFLSFFKYGSYVPGAEACVEDERPGLMFTMTHERLRAIRDAIQSILD